MPRPNFKRYHIKEAQFLLGKAKQKTGIFWLINMFQAKLSRVAVSYTLLEIYPLIKTVCCIQAKLSRGKVLQIKVEK